MFIPFCQDKHDKSRFLELLYPTTNNFNIWLATAAFSFFAYQSLHQSKEWACMIIDKVVREILPMAFLVFGGMCMLVIFYVVITWLSGYRIHIKKTKEKHIVRIKAKLGKNTGCVP